MYQPLVKNPLSRELPPLDALVFDAIWEVFVEIGKFWGNLPNPEPLRQNVYNFAMNRIGLYPIYADYYRLTPVVIADLKAEKGAQAFEFLFTDPDLTQSPPQTRAALIRQMVVSDLIAFQLALGGFAAFGAKNYCGYIGGTFVPNVRTPYRTFEETP